MAKKHVSTTYLTSFETVAGGILLLLYLFVLPFIADGLFRAAEHLLGVGIGPDQRSRICYYVLFALVLVIFYQFIGRTTGFFFASLGGALATAGAGLVAFYGLNELGYRLFHVLFGSRVNLSDVTISAQVGGTPSFLYEDKVVNATSVQVPRGTLVVVRIDGYQGYFKFDGPCDLMIPGQDLDGGGFFLAFQPTGDGALVAM